MGSLLPKCAHSLKTQDQGVGGGTYSHRKTRGSPTFVSDIQDGCSNCREVPLLLSAQDRGSHHWSCKSGKFSIIHSFVIIIIIIAVTISIIINISLNFYLQFQGWGSSLCSYRSTTTITITTILTTTTIKIIIIIRGGRYYRKKLSIADKSAFFKLSANYRYQN